MSILIASCLMVGRWRGTQPAANVSMITMQAPQHGQGCAGCSIDAAASSLPCISAGGVAATHGACQRHGRLADVLARIAEHPIQNLDQVLPWNWKPIAAKLAA